jgi:polysaccharide export outer membrane protein
MILFPQSLSKVNWQSLSLAGCLFLSCPLSQSAFAQFAPPSETVPTINNPQTNVNWSETEYTLGPGDRLKIDIFQVPEYSAETPVLVDGTVNLSLIGKVKVQDMTLTQMGEALAQSYARYIKRPIVTVSLVAPRALKISLSGEINNPGPYTVSLDQQMRFPSLTDLIQKAGGLTTVADISQVQIRRVLQGREQQLNVNLWELLNQGNLNQDISLRDGDSIFIPTKTTIDLKETRQLVDANFGIQAGQAVNVAIIGEVYRPGAYQLTIGSGAAGGKTEISGKPQPPRLTQAIGIAGGIKPLANIREIQIKRSTRTGNEQLLNVDLWALLETGNTNEDVILQEGDTIVIPTATEFSPQESETLASASFSPATIQVNVVGEVAKPGPVEIPPNTPLTKGLLAAGGFNGRASKGSVELIRLNPNGTVTKRKIPVDFAEGINNENNPALRNNDVIVVNTSGLAKLTDTLGTVLAPFSILRVFSQFSLF